MAAFVDDLGPHRDRAMALGMLLGGLRAGGIGWFRLTDVDMGLRRVRVVGKSGRERVVPIDRPFLSEVAAYLRSERPAGLSTPECFRRSAEPDGWSAVEGVAATKDLPDPPGTLGSDPSAAASAPDTYGTELAQARIDLLTLRGATGPRLTGDHSP